ncbi:DUF2493 domain-containing protein, partial [bacterium]|nr:DUF2493 domain-containing protein [bacterium]
FSKLKIKQAEIVSGGCRGADKLGEQFAEDNGLEIKQFLPEWKKFGKAAGIKRNAEMISYIRQFPCAAVIAFWDLQSKGTKFTVEQAQKYNIPVYIIEYGSRSISENAASGDSGDSADCGITLVNTKIHSHQALQNIYFYEYRIDKKADRSARAQKNAKKTRRRRLQSQSYRKSR